MRLGLLLALFVCGTSYAGDGTHTDETQPTGVAAEAKVPGEDKDPAERTSRLTLGPAGVLFGTLPIEYERRLTPTSSIALGLQTYYPALGAAVGTYSVGAIVSVAYRSFPVEAHAPRGLWVGAEVHGGYVYTQIDLASLGAGGTAVGDTLVLARPTVGAVAVAGYTMISAGGFTMSGGGGLGLAYAPGNASITTSVPALSPTLTIHANIGKAF